jgi:hypothetical protein
VLVCVSLGGCLVCCGCVLWMGVGLCYVWCSGVCLVVGFVEFWCGGMRWGVFG